MYFPCTDWLPPAFVRILAALAWFAAAKLLEGVVIVFAVARLDWDLVLVILHCLALEGSSWDEDGCLPSVMSDV